MQSITGLSSVIDRYDALLLDLWGVIHDGTHLYPDVQETLVALRSAGKKIIFISNAPRRAAKAAVVLNQLGVKREWYDDIITSGEMGYRWLASDAARWGKRYFYIGPSKDLDILEGLDYQRVDDIRQCDFLLNVGFGSDEQSSNDWHDLLGDASKLALPMLCLNPDFEVVKISGEIFPCAGVLALDYETFGGKVTYFGKPFPDIYDHCMEWLKPVSKARLLAVGDGLATDISGAARYGIDSVLVTGGILKNKDKNIEALCQKQGVTPTYVIPSFRWPV